jgi:hypothetical protein
MRAKRPGGLTHSGQSETTAVRRHRGHGVPVDLAISWRPGRTADGDLADGNPRLAERR